MLAFDTEHYLYRPGLAAPKLVCGSWANATQENIGDPAQTIAFFKRNLERGEHLVGINLPNDIVVLAAHDPALLELIFKAGDAGLFHDCMVREALHDIAIDKLFKDYETGKSFAKGEDFGGRYSMAVLMKRHFKKDISADKTGDVWRYKYAQLDGKPLNTWPLEAIAYPKRDARYTWNIANAQKNHQNLHDEAAQVRAAIAIQFMKVWGFRVDPDYLAWLEGQVDAVWNEARKEFTKAGIFRGAGKKSGSKDTTLLKAMVTAAYKGDPPMTKGGKKRPPTIATDRDTLVESGDPLLEKLGNSGKNDKRKTQYIPALKKGIVVPINPEFNVIVNTGRVSSDFQQLPQQGGIREAIVARPGMVLLSCDFGGLELRTMSQRAIDDPDVGFSMMADFINSGRDPHIHVAATFLGITYEECFKRYKAGDAVVKAFRSLGKIFNFGKGGGMGDFAMAYNARTKDNTRFCLVSGRSSRCGEVLQRGRVAGKEKRVCALCVAVSKELGIKWLRAWPEQGKLFAKSGRLTANNRKASVTVFGSKRVRGGCGYTQWLNTPFQGAGGDGTKAAMWKLAVEQYTSRRSPLWGCRTFLNVHDELLLELIDEPQRRHDAAFAVAKLMVDVMNKITPDVKNEVEPAIMRRLFKAASAVYDSKKLLRPWWPLDAKQAWHWQPDHAQMHVDLAA